MKFRKCLKWVLKMARLTSLWLLHTHSVRRKRLMSLAFDTNDFLFANTFFSFHISALFPSKFYGRESTYRLLTQNLWNFLWIPISVRLHVDGEKKERWAHVLKTQKWKCLYQHKQCFFFFFCRKLCQFVCVYFSFPSFASVNFVSLFFFGHHKHMIFKSCSSSSLLLFSLVMGEGAGMFGICVWSDQ